MFHISWFSPYGKIGKRNRKTNNKIHGLAEKLTDENEIINNRTSSYGIADKNYFRENF